MLDELSIKIILTSEVEDAWLAEVCKTPSGRALLEYYRNGCACGQNNCARTRIQAGLAHMPTQELLSELFEELEHHLDATYAKIGQVIHHWIHMSMHRFQLEALRYPIVHEVPSEEEDLMAETVIPMSSSPTTH